MAENHSNPPPTAAPPQDPDSSTAEAPVSGKKEVDVQEKQEEVVAVAEEKQEEVVAVAEEKQEEEVAVAEEKQEEEVAVAEEKEPKRKIPESLESFKEESNRVWDLSEWERKALEELKKAVREDMNSDGEQEVWIWGVPLLKDERSDVILLKFLRAREFRVKEAHAMIRKTLEWRKEFDIEGLLSEDLGEDLEKVVFMHGHSRQGHPVCYNVYGEFQNKDLYRKAFSTHDSRTNFLRSRIQLLERSIRNLDFSPGGINTIFQVNDLKNSPGPAKRELRLATKQALQLLQDNFPEFVAKQVFINVPWWYLAFYTMISPFLTQRTKSKFVFAGPSNSSDALFKYIAPEQVPIQYGGLSVDFCDCNPDFSMSDPVTQIPIKPNTKQTVEIAIYEKCIIVWELRVVGWEVTYNAEFKPDAKDGYTVIINKPTKMSPSDEPVISNTFKVSELGKLFLTVDNPTLKKKTLLYRFNIKPYCD